MAVEIQKYWHLLWSIITIFSCFYIVLLIILYFFQSHLIYYPSRKIAATPDIIGIPYKEVSFKTEDGITLSAWYIPALRPKNVILFCHGNAGNIGDRLESIQIFYNMGLSIFIFDYRGYGKSEGKASEKGTYLDSEAAWRYLVNEQDIPPERIIIFGRSLGGAIASRLAQNNTPKGLILESSFTSVKDIASKFYPFLPVKLLSRFSYATLDYVKKVNCPVFIIHSRDDEIIPFSHGITLFDTANDPKAFLELKGSHNEGFITSLHCYKNGLNTFISRYGG
ncbi:MAG: alpha/beta hydrolase [Thermodesulfobacteriota bacterium]|nr:alpha/beta hydrolase [Thermodesulfobacteriota bacterium]